MKILAYLTTLLVPLLINSQTIELKTDSIFKKNYTKANQYLRSHKDSARFFYRRALTNLHNKSKEALVNKMIGISYAFESKFDSAAYYMNKSYEIYTNLGDTLNQAFMLNNIGLVSTNNDQYEKGIKNLIESLKLKDKLLINHPHKKLDIGSTQLNIGINFHNIFKYDKAEEYYTKALNSYAQDKNTLGVNKSKGQLANIYFDRGEPEKAVIVFEDLIKNKAFENNDFILAKIYNNYASSLIDIYEYNKAEKILLKSYKLNKKVGNIRSCITNLNNLSEVYFSKKHYAKSIKFAKKSLKASRKAKCLKSEYNAIKCLAKNYDKLNNTSLALNYYKLKDKLKDSLYIENQAKAIAELETKYETEKKQQKIQLLASENKLKKIQLKQKTKLNYLYFIAIIVLTVFLIIAYYVNKHIRKQRIELDFKNNELKILNSSLQKMFKIISHDLKNLISGFKGASSLISFYTQKNDSKKLLSLSEKLAINSSRLDILLNNLLNWAISQDNLYKPKIEDINIHELAENQLALLKDMAKKKNIVLYNKTPEEFNVKFDENGFSFIVRNLLSNAVKFTQNGVITISAGFDNGKKYFSITDTGKGMNKEQKEILFTEKLKSELGTEGEVGTGLGLKLVKDFVDINKANIEVKTKPLAGTTFLIYLN